MNQPDLERVHYDSARALVESKIEERPEDSRLHSALGIAYAGLGRKEDALREGTLAVELLPISKEAYRGAYRAIDLAQIYAMVGETDADLPFETDREVRLAPTHHVGGNVVRFNTGIVSLTPDIEWQRELPLGEKITITALTAPWLGSYGYSICC